MFFNIKHELPAKWVALLPFALFMTVLVEYSLKGQPIAAFWICHATNLLMALGLLFASPLIVSAAVEWMVLGNAYFIVDVVTEGAPTWFSIASHFGGLLIALWIAVKIRPPKKAWLFGWLYSGLLFFGCKFFDGQALNINLALRSPDAIGIFHRLPGGYETFSAGIIALDFIALFTIQWIWQKLKKAEKAP